MRVSLNTIKQYIDFELPPVDELGAQINAQLGGVEEVTDLTAKYKDVVIVKVVECEKHPNADKLSVCMIDDGGAVVTACWRRPMSWRSVATMRESSKSIRLNGSRVVLRSSQERVLPKFTA